MNNFLDKYKEDIEYLKKVTGKKIKNDRDDINVLSKISEIKFGKYLAERFVSNIQYEPLVLNKTPDWLVECNGDKIIFEVLKINLPNEELEKKIQLYKDNQLNFDFAGIYSGLACLNRNDSDKILRKEEVYRELVEMHNYNLIICIDATDWDKKLDVMDIQTSFDFENKDSPFYNVNFVKNISGLIVEPYFGNVRFIPNHNVNKKLNKKNIDILKDNW